MDNENKNVECIITKKDLRREEGRLIFPFISYFVCQLIASLAVMIILYFNIYELLFSSKLTDMSSLFIVFNWIYMLMLVNHYIHLILRYCNIRADMLITRSLLQMNLIHI